LSTADETVALGAIADIGGQRVKRDDNGSKGPGGAASSAGGGGARLQRVMRALARGGEAREAKAREATSVGGREARAGKARRAEASHGRVGVITPAAPARNISPLPDKK